MSQKLLFCFLLFSHFSFGQTQESNDSLITVICNTLNASNTALDSSTIKSTLKKHLYPYLLKYPGDQQFAIVENIAFRLQRNCPAFLEFTEKLKPQKGDWQTLSERPITKLSRNSCDTFLTYKKYKYLESNGDTVNLTIENGYWVDTFKDGTYSKLKFIRIKDCEFEIEFIESNNSTRANFSKKGDKYLYQIVEKRGNQYLMTTEAVGVGKTYGFVIYL